MKRPARLVVCVVCGEEKPLKSKGRCDRCDARARKQEKAGRVVVAEEPPAELPAALRTESRAAPAPAALAEEPVTLCLTFAGEDVDLYRQLEAVARMWRRTPENQVLYMLECSRVETPRIGGRP